MLQSLEALQPFNNLNRPKWGKGRSAIALVILFLAAFAANFNLIQQNDERISILDEWSYIDYIFQSAEGSIVLPGEFVKPESLDYLACHEVIGIGPIGSGCGEQQLRADFPLNAQSPAEIHPPTYFFITAQLAKIPAAVLPQLGIIDSARLIGTVWLFLGLGVWLVAFWLLGARMVSAFSVSALVAFSPLVLSVTNYLTPDATFALTSGVVFLATILWLKQLIAPWWLMAAGAFPVLFKVTHLLAVFVAVALVWGIGFLRQRRRALDAILASSLLLVGTVLGLVTWQLIRGLIRVAPSPSHPNAPWELNIGSFVRELGYHIQTLPQFPGSVLPVPPGTSIIGNFFGWLIAAAAIGGLLYLSAKSQLWMLAAIASGAAFFGAAALSLIILVLAGGFLNPEARYGLPFLFTWVTPLVMVMRSKVATLSIASLAVLSWIALFIPNAVEV